ncbi:MAG TPA: hypothetical protein VIV12_20845 [Streptosporangiaceae bacterium]
MRRKTFDALATIAGFALAVVLLVAGGLLLWGHNFVSDQVHSQLAAQKIVFPPKSSPAIKELPAADAAAMSKYSGQLMTNGAQAQTYADHFILVHLDKVANGQTYAQVSGKALQNPNNAQLQEQVATLFKGTALRGMLLNAYAFWKIGQIAFIAAIVAFVGAGIFLLLAALGLVHQLRVAPDKDLFIKREAAREPAGVH